MRARRAALLVRAVAVALAVILASAACGKRDETWEVPPAPPVPRQPDVEPPVSAERGRALFEKKGCVSCHTIDGTPKVGPSLRGVIARALDGSTRFSDGTIAKDLIGPGKPFADVRAYLADQFLRPRQRVIAGYPPTAPAYDDILKPRETESLVLYLETLEPPPPPPSPSL